MKSPEMEKSLRNIFPNRKNMDEGRCVFCGEKVGGFRNIISEKEYQISGMCQKCQDETFGID